MRLTLKNRTLGVSVIIGLLTLIFVVVFVYAASDCGTTHDVVWSYSVDSLDYSGATEETDSRHAYSVQNNRNESIKLSWEFSHKVQNAAGNVVHDATEWDQGNPINIPAGGSQSDNRLIRTAVEHLAQNQDYTIKAYTAIRINPPQGAQLFAEGEDDGEEFDFDR